MRSAITVLLGIILLCAAFSGRSGGFYRVRTLVPRKFGRIVMRVVYGLAGIFLIALAFADHF